jgi:hypothetical protein
MTREAKEDLSRASWMALLGLAIVLLSALAGMPIARLLMSNEDEAAVSGLVCTTGSRAV